MFVEQRSLYKGEKNGRSKTQVTGHCSTDTVTTLTPFLMLTLGLSATLRQCFRPKHYTETLFRLKISIRKGLGCSSIDNTMIRDLHLRPARKKKKQNNLLIQLNCSD